MTDLINAQNPRFHQALAEFKAECGFSVSEVLLPTQWAVGIVDGRAEVLLNDAGARALALIAPSPDAPHLMEALIAARDAASRRVR